jgi:hypothetical protein
MHACTFAKSDAMIGSQLPEQLSCDVILSIAKLSFLFIPTTYQEW